MITPRQAYQAAEGALAGAPDAVLSWLLIAVAVIAVGLALWAPAVVKAAAVLYLGLP